jgi:hypothetical protein
MFILDVLAHLQYADKVVHHCEPLACSRRGALIDVADDGRRLGRPRRLFRGDGRGQRPRLEGLLTGDEHPGKLHGAKAGM